MWKVHTHTHTHEHAHNEHKGNADKYQNVELMQVILSAYNRIKLDIIKIANTFIDLKIPKPYDIQMD